MTLREASKLSSYSQEYLSLLARKGKIDSIKLERNWVITEKSLKEYTKKHKKKSKK